MARERCIGPLATARILVLVLSFGLATSHVVEGAPITFGFTARVTAVQEFLGSVLDGSVVVGTVVTGQYSFNNPQTDMAPALPLLGFYKQMGIQLTFGTYSVQPNLAASNPLEVALFTSDEYFLQSTNQTPIAGLTSTSTSFDLQAPSGTVFGGSDALPLVPFPLSSATVNNTLQIAGFNSGGGVPFVITAEVISFEDLAATPEPATLLLFGTTVTGLGLARWKRRR